MVQPGAFSVPKLLHFSFKFILKHRDFIVVLTKTTGKNPSISGYFYQFPAIIDNAYVIILPWKRYYLCNSTVTSPSNYLTSTENYI